MVVAITHPIFAHQINLSLESRLKPISDRVQKAFKRFEYFWGYAGKAVATVRLFLTASLKTCSRFTLGCRQLDARVLRVTTRMQLFSIVSVPFNLANLHSVTNKLHQSLKWHDAEGVALSSLSFTVISAEIISSTTTFINSALIVLEKTAIGLFAQIGMPLAFGVVGLGSISKTIQIAKTYFLIKDLPTFLEKNLEEAKEMTKCLRFAPKEAIPLIEQLHQLFKNHKILTKDQEEKVFKSLDKIHFLLRKKMDIEILGLFANALTFIGLCFFFVATAPASLPFLFLSAAFIVRIATLIYQDLA
jgi:hypothetical protein